MQLLRVPNERSAVLRQRTGLLNAHIPPLKDPPRAELQYAQGGSLAKLSFKESKGVNQHPNLFPNGFDGKRQSRNQGGGLRGEVTTLSRQSRLSFLRALARINFSECKGKVLFLTLTYPKGHSPRDPQAWKEQLERLRKRVGRKYGKVPGFWRLELKGSNSRIVPHFHLFLFLEEKLSKEDLTQFRIFVSESWYEVCGKLSENHLRAGVQVKRIASRRDWERLSRYVGKKEEVQGQSLPIGRRWGKWHEKLLPITLHTVQLPREDAMATRRVLRKQAGTKRRADKLLTQQVFIRDTTMRRYLEWRNLDRE